MRRHEKNRHRNIGKYCAHRCPLVHGLVEPHALPALFLQLLPQRLDPLPVDVPVALADPGRRPVLDVGLATTGEPKLDVIDELRVDG